MTDFRVYFTILIFMGVFMKSPCQQDTIYIDPANKNDLQEDGSISHPYDSWADIIWTPGNTYFQKRGTVSYGVYVNIDSSGTNENDRIYIGAYGNGSLPVIDGNNKMGNALRCRDQAFISIRDLKFTKGVGDCLGISNTDHLMLESIECYNSKAGAHISGDSITIINSVFHDCAGSGLRLTEGIKQIVRNCEFFNNSTEPGNEDALFIGNGSSDFLIEGCIAHDNPGTDAGCTGFDCSGDIGAYTKGIFRRCLSYNNGNRGFASSGAVTDTVHFEYCLAYNNHINFMSYEDAITYITNCTSGSATEGGIVLYQNASATVRNCLFTGNTPRIIKLTSNTINLASSYNCLYSDNLIRFEKSGSVYTFTGWKGIGYDVTGSFSENPYINSYFRLLDDSPCIDAGIFLENIHGGAGAVDLDSIPVTDNKPDIGAYEYTILNIINKGRILNKSIIYNYPNPFNKSTTIEIEDNNSLFYRFTLYNISGRKIISKIIDNPVFLFNREGLSNGIYFFVIESKNVEYKGKLIIK